MQLPEKRFCLTWRKWNVYLVLGRGMAMVVAPELSWPGGHPQGYRRHLREVSQPSVYHQNFLLQSLSPVLASSGCYLEVAGQSSLGLVAVAAMPGKPSAGESPARAVCTTRLCSSLLFCPVALLPPHFIHTAWPQIENCASLFSLQVWPHIWSPLTYFLQAFGVELRL